MVQVRNTTGVYTIAQDVLKVGSPNVDANRTITLQACFAVLTSNISAGVFTKCGTLPAGYRPAHTVSFALPTDLPLVGNPALSMYRINSLGTWIGMSGADITYTRVTGYITSDGDIFVKFLTPANPGQVQEIHAPTTWYVFPINVTFFNTVLS